MIIKKMPKYDIHRWDGVIPYENTFPMPMIYVKPGDDFEKYAKENDYQIVAELNGTGTGYDGKKMVGIIDVSGYYPNYRPNFFNKEKYYTITLFAQWKGYPITNGTVTIQGTEGPDKIPKVEQEYPGITKPFPTQAVGITSWEPYQRTSEGFSGPQLGMILTFFLVVFCVFVVIRKTK